MKPNLLSGLLAMLTLGHALPAQTFQSGPTATALVELYTSEGCSSCPPAERWLSALKTDKNLWSQIVPIAFHITYWDDLGWPDPYARTAFTQRQHNYANAWNAHSIYTPEFVYQGREWHPGNLTPSPGCPGVLTLKRSSDGSGSLSFKPVAPSSAQFYDASVAVLGADVSIKIRAGENAGRTLAHDFVALHLADILLVRADDGTFTASFSAPPANLPAAPKHALIAWISSPNGMTPIQATGGWID